MDDVKAKEYANIVKMLQVALKREQQAKIQKANNEKQQSLVSSNTYKISLRLN